MGRIRRGIELTRVSWAVVKAEKGLMGLPLLSAVISLVAWGVLMLAAYAIGGAPETTGPAGAQDTQYPAVYYLFVGLAYGVSAFIAVYFNAVVIGVATIRLRGGDPTLKDGFRLANSKLPKIIGWALLTATVGLVLRMLDERAGILGSIAVAIIGIAWAVLTFFVVPVLLYEQVGVFGGIKRSSKIFKERWGEQFTGNAVIGLIFGLGILVAIIVGGLLVMVVPGAPLKITFGVLGLAGVLILIGLNGAVSGVFNAALYQYATTGEATGGFTEDALAGAFRPKKKGLFRK